MVVEQRFLPEKEEPEKHFMQEKDLKNHISAMPEDDISEELEEADDMKEIDLPDEEPSDEVEELLTKDNQVGRALEILASWEIFSKMGL